MGWWNNLFCGSLVKKVNDLEKELEKTKETLENTEDKYQSCMEENKELKEELQKLKPPEEKEFWNNKHQKKHVMYERPIYMGEDKWEVHKIPVPIFLTPNDFIIQAKLKKNDLMIDNPMKINEVAPKIYQLAKENYDYKHDDKNLGRSEYWRFPFETRETKGDCEDWAHTIASYLIGAGIPRWRVRVTYGVINNMMGAHSTVYVLDDSMDTWRHLNSTSPSYDYNSLEEYPKFGDRGDDLGIHPDKVWGSFNDKHAWTEFSNRESKQEYEEHPISDKLIIDDI